MEINNDTMIAGSVRKIIPKKKNAMTYVNVLVDGFQLRGFLRVTERFQSRFQFLGKEKKGKPKTPNTSAGSLTLAYEQNTLTVVWSIISCRKASASVTFRSNRTRLLERRILVPGVLLLPPPTLPVPPPTPTPLPGPPPTPPVVKPIALLCALVLPLP